MRKIFLFFVSLGIILGLFFAIGNSFINKNEEIIESGESSEDFYVHELNLPIMEIDSLNPLLTYNEQVSNILNLIYEPLIGIDKNDSLKPILATEWAEKSDYTWIIKLRNDVSWHNGNNFTSNDVIFTINQLLNAEVDSPYKENVKNITNVSKIDNYSLSITLSQRDAFFAYKLTFPIVPENYFKDVGIANDYKNNRPVGTGAYKYLENLSEGSIIHLKINNSWWNYNAENTRLQNIYLYKYSTYGEAIKAYKSLETDVIVTTLTDWEKKFGTIGNNVYSYESSIYDMIVPNTSKSVLSDSSVRKAILTAINRENIGDRVFDSNITINDVPIHTRSESYVSTAVTEYSIDKAKQILINAGWVYDGNWKKNNVTLKFNLLVNENNSEHVKSAEIVKENLNEIGISVNIQKVSWNNLKSTINEGNFELAMVSIDVKNELTLLDLVTDGGSYNYSKYMSKACNEAISNIKNNCNSDTIKELEKIYKSDTPYIGLYFRNNNILTNKSVKGSIEPTWWNPYENITSWCK